ncbi:MAG TPA: OmpA family protein [Abditibacteriaceae bacterium]
MKKRRDVFSFFANPFVVLADIMVCLMFIIALFLLATTIYTKEVESALLLKQKRENMADSLEGQLKERGFQAKRENLPQSKDKYRLGNLLIGESDGSLQRFKFLGGRLDFKTNQAFFVQDETARQMLRILGHTLLQNRSAIKSIVIEGHAAPSETQPWLLSQQRAEAVRRQWARDGFLGKISWSAPIAAVGFLKSINKTEFFHQWHLEEYQARRAPANNGLGVIPEAWIISSGRGDSVSGESSVEFKIEYTERGTHPLDTVLQNLGEPHRAEALKRNLFVPDTIKPGNP